jgi:DHA3 family macrolide efflux protein-like MFS transporter
VVSDNKRTSAGFERPERWQAPFFAIWGGQAISLVGSRAMEFAIIWWLTRETGSATVLATSALMWAVPQVVLGPLIGAYVDRLNRRLVMIGSDVLTALVALGLAFLFWTGDIRVWQIYVAMFLRAVSGCFQWPAMQASTALMVPDKHLTRISGLNQTMQGALNIVGPPLGAVLVAVLPLQSILLMDVATMALAVLPLCFVRIPQPRRDDVATRKPSVWSDVREGFRYVWGWPGLFAIVVMAMLLNFIGGPAFTLVPLLVTDHFGGGALELGWMESSLGVGLLVGGLVLSTWGGFRRRVYTALSALALSGLAMAVIGAAPARLFWVAVGAQFASGALNSLTNGPFMALMQATVAPEKQGRVFAVVASLCSAAYPLSLFIAGPLADVFGVRPWYLVGGLLTSAIGIGALFVPTIVAVEENGYAARGSIGFPDPSAAAAGGNWDHLEVTTGSSRE